MCCKGLGCLHTRACLGTGRLALASYMLSATFFGCHVQLRLNSEQRQQKEAAEAAIADLQDQETLETDPDAKVELQKQIADGKAGLDDLMEAFAVSARESPQFRQVDEGRCRVAARLPNRTKLVHAAALSAAQKSTLEAAAKGEIQRPSERRAAQVCIPSTRGINSHGSSISQYVMG